ncbi:MAG: hypothetical protein AAF713_21195 [Pseudomonadota bacterium]
MPVVVVELGTLSDKTLDEWIAKQRSWRLNEALMLLAGIDPEISPTEINPDDDKEHEVLVRWLEAAKFAMQNGDLVDTSFNKGNQIAGADFSVTKRDFIAWAGNKFPEQSARMARRLATYDTFEEKPFQRVRLDQRGRTHRAFLEVAEKLTDNDWVTLSRSKIIKRVRDEASPLDEIYSRTVCHQHFDSWIVDFLEQQPGGNALISRRRTRKLLK